jgi:predicted amidophosphoribosyltransferase
LGKKAQCSAFFCHPFYAKRIGGLGPDLSCRVRSNEKPNAQWEIHCRKLHAARQLPSWLTFDVSERKMSHKISGNWDKGYAVDLHTISSTPCGVNAYGHTIFDNKYTMLGELMNRCKYKNDSAAVPLIAQEVITRVTSISKFDIIIPVPPSNQFRTFQPVAEIAKAICISTGVKLLEGAFDVKPRAQLKSINDPEERIKILKESITLSRIPEIEGKSVLIFDDLFRSGSTLTVICDLLRPHKPSRICVLTVTKTRSNK